MLSKPAAAKWNYAYTGETYQSPAGILLHSRTAVEKDNFVSTGVLTYAEGDIVEIEISEYKWFHLGDSVKITVYSPGGIYTFQSTVVAKDQGALMLINPPQNQRRFAEKREFPRVEVDETGWISAVICKPLRKKRLLEEQIEFRIHNISVSGLGFTLREESFLEEVHQIDLELNIGFALSCRAELVRHDSLGDNGYYGVQFIDIAADQVNSIRAFVLRKQIESYFSRKQVETEKRMFK